MAVNLEHPHSTSFTPTLRQPPQETLGQPLHTPPTDHSSYQPLGTLSRYTAPPNALHQINSACTFLVTLALRDIIGDQHFLQETRRPPPTFSTPTIQFLESTMVKANKKKTTSASEELMNQVTQEKHL
jgi:hypothetical protein